MKRGMMVAYPCTGLPVIVGMFYAYYKYVLREQRVSNTYLDTPVIQRL